MSTDRERLDAFVDDLRRTLDLPAGLADAIRPGAYDALATDLAGTLDVDAGLAAAVRGGTTARSAPRIADRLRALADTERLDLRVHPDYRILCTTVALAVTLADARDTARALDDAGRLTTLRGHLDHAHDLARELGLGLAYVLDRNRDKLTGDLSGVHNLSRALRSSLDRSHARTLARIADVGLAVDLGFADDPALDDPRELARLLDLLVRTGDDFTGADLSTAGPRAMPDLHGVRWSPATTWPDALGDAVRAASVEIEPGTFVVTGDARRGVPAVPG